MHELKGIHFNLLYKCNLTCAHCCMNSGPDRTEELPVDLVLKCLDEIGPISRLNTIIFGGGEPFLYKGLAEVCERSRRWNKRIVLNSNCFWAKNVKIAKERLAPLKIKELQVSSDQYHQEAGVPYEYTKNAITAAIQLGIGVRAACIDDVDTVKKLKADFGEKFKVRFVGALHAGRSLSGEYRTPIAFARRGCSDDVDRRTLTISPRGNVMLCSVVQTMGNESHPLIIGNAFNESLVSIIEKREKDPLLHEACGHNLCRSLNIIRGAGLGDKLDPGYFSACDLCAHILGDEEMRAALRDAYSSDPVYTVDIPLSNGTYRFKVRGMDFHDIIKKTAARRRPYKLVDLVNACLVGKLRFTTERKGDPKNLIIPISAIGDAVFDILDIAYGPMWRRDYGFWGCEGWKLLGWDKAHKIKHALSFFQ